MIIFRNKCLSNTLLTVEVSLQSSKHILDFKTILSFEIKRIGKRRDYLIVSWKPKDDSLRKMCEVDIVVVRQFEQTFIDFFVFPDVVPEENLFVEVYLAIVRQQVTTIMQII